MKADAQRGQTLPLIGVTVLLLTGMAGFAVDAGYHQYEQRMQQTASDSAALAGAAERPMGDWSAAAKQDATINGFTDNAGGQACDTTAPAGRICVNVYNPPQAGDPYNGDSAAVEVDITESHATFFERVFGINTVPVTTKAVATVKTVPSNDCLFVLNGGANFNGQTGGGTVTATNCGLVFNQGANFHGATVTADSIQCAAACSGGTFVQATPQPSAPQSDPCPAIAFCAHMANPAPTCTSPTNLSHYTDGSTITPGCYSGMDLKNATNVVFGCGLYVLTGALNARATGKNPAPINISQSCGAAGPAGVTFYLAGGGSIDMGNDNINLTAPTSGDYTQYSAGEQNTLIYQAPGNNSTVNLQSASCQTCQSFFSGMIYAPSANLNYNQYTTTTQGAVLIITGSLNANGGVNSIFNAPGGQPTYNVQVPVLGE